VTSRSKACLKSPEKLETLIETILTQQPSVHPNFDQDKFNELQSFCREMATQKQRQALLEKIQKQEQEHNQIMALAIWCGEDID